MHIRIKARMATIFESEGTGVYIENGTVVAVRNDLDLFGYKLRSGETVKFDYLDSDVEVQIDE